MATGHRQAWSRRKRPMREFVKIKSGAADPRAMQVVQIPGRVEQTRRPDLQVLIAPFLGHSVGRDRFTRAANDSWPQPEEQRLAGFVHRHHRQHRQYRQHSLSAR